MRLSTACRRYACSAPTPRGSNPSNPLKRLKQGLLDKVVGVGQVSRPPGQPAAGPAPERREVPLEQELKGVGVAGPGAINQMQRRLRIAAGRRATL